MAAANGSAVQYYYTVETSPGVIAATAPSFTPIRFNTTSLAVNTAQVDSAEINSLRQRPKAKQGTYSTQGEIVSELSDDSFDDLLMYLMQQSAWTTDTLKVGDTVATIAILERHTDVSRSRVSKATISFAALDNSISDSGSGFVTAGFAVGDTITVTGATNAVNNASFVITAVTAGKLTIGGLDGDVIIDEAAGATVTITSPLDYIYYGCRVNSLAVSAQIDARVGVTFGVIGTDADEYTLPGDAVLGTAGTSDPMVTSVGSVTEGGTALAYATAYDFTLNNGMAPTFALHQRAAYDVQNGILTATGSLSAYAPDGTLYAKFLDETETTLVFEFSDGTNTMSFTFPDVIYTQADGGVSGPDAIVRQYQFSAGYDATAATTVTITRSA